MLDGTAKRYKVATSGMDEGAETLGGSGFPPIFIFSLFPRDLPIGAR